MQLCERGLQDLEYDLSDSAHWEYVVRKRFAIAPGCPPPHLSSCHCAQFPSADSVRLPSSSVLNRDPALMDVDCAESWVEELTLEPKVLLCKSRR
jgi:hypothetical protein